MIDKVSLNGRTKIRIREGEKLIAYLDTQSVWTIGTGHTGRMSGPKVYKGMVITKEQSDALLEADLAPVEKALNSVLKFKVTQNQYDALASFLFNVGVGWAGVGGHQVASMFTKINAGDVWGAAQAFDLFHKPAEIIGRRNGEKAQFLTPDNLATKETVMPVQVSKDEKAKVDVFAGIGNIAQNIVESIESSVTATKSPNIPQVGDGGLVFGTINDGMKAVSEIKELIGDIRSGKIADMVDDAIDLLKIIFAVLARYHINVPVVSQIVAVLPDLNPAS